MTMTPEQLAALVADAEQTRPDDHVVRDLIAGLRWLADLHNTTADTLALVDSPLKRRAQDLLLAERDALTAEVARLSTPPDDAKVAEMVMDLMHTGEMSMLYRCEIANALMRLSHALAAETAKREAMEEALTGLLEPFGDDPCRYDHHGKCQEHFIEDDCCVARARATLAKHGSK